MNAFEKSLNAVLTDTFNHILKYEESSLRKITKTPVTISEAHMIEAVGKGEAGRTTVSELAAALDITAPTATVAVKKLESKGFLKKVPCGDDGRKHIISLTDSGRRVEKIHHLFHEKMVRSISGRVPEEERGTLMKALVSLSEFFRSKSEPRI